MTQNNPLVELPDVKKAKTNYFKLQTKYEKVLRKTFHKVENLISNKTDVNAIVKCRLKDFESYYQKIANLSSHNSNPIITDLLGIRIICPFLEDVDRVQELLEKHFDVVEVEKKGLKHNFKEFGYDSVHLLIKLASESLPNLILNTQKVVEVQIRTKLQDAWAEIEHELIYKANYSLLNEPIKRKLASLNASLTLSDIIFQEIRDYQKDIQRRAQKRREELIQKAELSTDSITIEDKYHEMRLKKEESKITIPGTHKNPIEKLLFEALQLHSDSEFEKANDKYSQILKMRVNPKIRSIVYNHRGMALFVLERYKDAINDFTKAIKYSPENYRAYNNRGLVYRQTQQLGKAIDDYNKSLEINAFQVETFYNRAISHYDLHDYTHALEDCKKALSIKPDFITAERLKLIIEAKMFS